jgi:hypothetical protein
MIIFPVRMLDEKCLGIWAKDGRFFRVRAAEGDDLRQLAKQVYEGTCTMLEREFRQEDPPPDGEATDTFGNCMPPPPAPQRGMRR